MLQDVDSILNNPSAAKDVFKALDLANFGVIAPHKRKYYNKYDIQWLIDSINSGDKHSYVTFWHEDEKSENNIFSQWYYQPFVINGRKYVTAEQYMMSEKALLFNDLDMYKKIMNESDPHACKQYGRNVRNFDSKIWSESFREILFHGNLGKFQSNHELLYALLSTEDAVLIEASSLDDNYGAGLDKMHLLNSDGSLKVLPQEWHMEGTNKQATNHLGFILMGVRDFFNDLMRSKGI